MSIQTVPTLKRSRSRLDRYRRSGDQVIAVMHKDGLALHCSYGATGGG